MKKCGETAIIMFTANSGKRNFECLLQLFEFIINLVEQNMAKADTVFWKGVPTEKCAEVGL